VNLSKVNPTSVNNNPVQDTKVVAHDDVFTVADRLFRVEFPHGSPARVLQPVSWFCLRKIFWVQPVLIVLCTDLVL